MTQNSHIKLYKTTSVNAQHMNNIGRCRFNKSKLDQDLMLVLNASGQD